MHSASACSFPPLISRIHSCLFSDWRRTVSSKFFDTQAPSISTEELVLPCHACCVYSHLCCNGHSLLLSSHLFRIGRIENPSYSACGHSSQDTSHLILHCPTTDSCTAHSLTTLCLCMASGTDPEEFPGFWALWFSAMPPALGMSRVINNNNSVFATISTKKHYKSRVMLLKFDNEI